MIATRGNTGLGSCEPLVTTFASVDQYIILFYVSFCLKTPYSICIFWFIGIEPMANSTTPAWTKLSKYEYLLHKARHGLLALWTTKQNVFVILGLETMISPRKSTEIQKMGHLIGQEKGIAYRMRPEGRVSPCSPSAGNSLSWDMLTMSMWPQKFVRTDLGVKHAF